MGFLYSKCFWLYKTSTPLGTGMLRTEAYNLGINTITLEVERDNTDMSIAAETELKMIMLHADTLNFHKSTFHQLNSF